MLAAISGQAAGAVRRQAAAGALAGLAALQRRGLAAAATVEGDTITVEVGAPQVAALRGGGSRVPKTAAGGGGDPAAFADEASAAGCVSRCLLG